MKTISFRIITTLIAGTISTILVMLFTILGDKTKGPLSDFFDSTEDWISKTENKLIVQKREDKRADKLAWLNPYKKNLELIKNPKLILLGAFDNQTTESFESVINLEDSLQTTFPIIHVYSAWGSKPEQKFPKTQVETILNLGSIPCVTWEPWLTDFDADENPKLRKPEDRDKGGLKDIAKGFYDGYINAWAEASAKIKSPIFLRLGHEMNDPYRYPWGPQNNTANDYIAAYRHVHDLFVKAGALNIIWVWSPHPAYGFFKEFYPGKNYVDFVGAGTLNYGTVASWSKWWSFDEIFGNYYGQLSAFKKPIMLTELGSLAVGGKRDAWFKAAFENLPVKYPLIKSILFFHFSDDKTITQQSVDWYIIKDHETLNAIKTGISKWMEIGKPKVVVK